MADKLLRFGDERLDFAIMIMILSFACNTFARDGVERGGAGAPGGER